MCKGTFGVKREGEGNGVEERPFHLKIYSFFSVNQCRIYVRT